MEQVGKKVAGEHELSGDIGKKKRKSFGYYADEVEAARAHDDGVRMMRGPDAKVNFPSTAKRAIGARSGA